MEHIFNLWMPEKEEGKAAITGATAMRLIEIALPAYGFNKDIFNVALQFSDKFDCIFVSAEVKPEGNYATDFKLEKRLRNLLEPFCALHGLTLTEV